MDDATVGLVRQRRNLVLLSVVIFFASVSGLHVKGDIHFFGTSLEVSQHRYLYLAIWFVWWWFLYRYYQYYAKEGASKVRTAVQEHFRNVLLQKLNREVRAEQPGKRPTDDGYRSYESVGCFHRFRVCAELAITRCDQSGGHQQLRDWEQIEPGVFFLEFVGTYIHFLVRRTEFSDYWFPLVFAAIVFVYSYFLGSWEGSFDTLSGG